MDNYYSDEFWKNIEIQDDFPLISLSSDEINQQNSNNVAEQADGAGDALDVSMEIDPLQGSFLLNSQNDPQLQALTQSGAIGYGDQSPEFGSPMLPQASMPLTAFHQNGPPYGINQAQGEPSNTNEGMPFVNLSGIPNQGVSQSVGVTASLQSPQAYNQVQLSNPMPVNTQNHGIGSINSYSQLLNQNINMGEHAHGRSMARDSQTWEHPELRELLAQQPAANSTLDKSPIPNSLYHPKYQQLCLPVDPHLRLFLAKKTREASKKKK